MQKESLKLVLKNHDVINFILNPEDLFDTNNVLRSTLMFLHELGPEYSALARGRIFFSVAGYDQISEELYERPEFQLFAKQLVLKYPHFYFFFPHKLVDLITMAVLDGKNISPGVCYVDPEKQKIFMQRCYQQAIGYGVHSGYSVDEMISYFENY